MPVQSRSKAVTYGGYKLEVGDGKHAQVPNSAVKIILNPLQRKALALAIKADQACLLTGETGTGKTSAVRYLAHKLKRPYVRVNLDGHITPDELIGSKAAKDGSTYFEYGVIIKAMLEGAFLVVDELNAAPPDTTFIFHSLLDDERAIRLPNNEVIRPHKDFRFFATMNPDYEGTKTLNRAFYDRFPIVIEFTTPSVKVEADIIQPHLNMTTGGDTMAASIVMFASMARKAYKAGKSFTYVSTRSLVQWAQLIGQGLTPFDAFTLCVSGKAASDELDAMRDLYNASFKTDYKGAAGDSFTIVEAAKYQELRETAAKLRADYDAIAERVKSLVVDTGSQAAA